MMDNNQNQKNQRSQVDQPYPQNLQKYEFTHRDLNCVKRLKGCENIDETLLTFYDESQITDKEYFNKLFQISIESQYSFPRSWDQIPTLGIPEPNEEHKYQEEYFDYEYDNLVTNYKLEIDQFFMDYGRKFEQNINQNVLITYYSENPELSSKQDYFQNEAKFKDIIKKIPFQQQEQQVLLIKQGRFKFFSEINFDKQSSNSPLFNQQMVQSAIRKWPYFLYFQLEQYYNLFGNQWNLICDSMNMNIFSKGFLFTEKICEERWVQLMCKRNIKVLNMDQRIPQNMLFFKNFHQDFTNDQSQKQFFAKLKISQKQEILQYLIETGIIEMNNGFTINPEKFGFIKENKNFVNNYQYQKNNSKNMVLYNQFYQSINCQKNIENNLQIEVPSLWKIMIKYYQKEKEKTFADQIQQSINKACYHPPKKEEEYAYQQMISQGKFPMPSYQKENIDQRLRLSQNQSLISKRKKIINEKTCPIVQTIFSNPRQNQNQQRQTQIYNNSAQNFAFNNNQYQSINGQNQQQQNRPQQTGSNGDIQQYNSLIPSNINQQYMQNTQQNIRQYPFPNNQNQQRFVQPNSSQNIPNQQQSQPPLQTNNIRRVVGDQQTLDPEYIKERMNAAQAASLLNIKKQGRGASANAINQIGPVGTAFSQTTVNNNINSSQQVGPSDSPHTYKQLQPNQLNQSQQQQLQQQNQIQNQQQSLNQKNIQYQMNTVNNLKTEQYKLNKKK